MRQRSMFLGTVLAIGLVWAGCSGGGDPGQAAEEPVETKTYQVRGMFARAEDDGVTMTVRHEEIPGYMAAMTMPFKVSDAALLEGLAYGDKIEFTLEVTGDSDRLLVTAIDKLPADTVLSFEKPAE